VSGEGRMKTCRVSGMCLGKITFVVYKVTMEKKIRIYCSGKRCTAKNGIIRVMVFLDLPEFVSPPLQIQAAVL
jgi:hypothetical protein